MNEETIWEQRERDGKMLAGKISKATKQFGPAVSRLAELQQQYELVPKNIKVYCKDAGQCRRWPKEDIVEFFVSNPDPAETARAEISAAFAGQGIDFCEFIGLRRQQAVMFDEFVPFSKKVGEKYNIGRAGKMAEVVESCLCKLDMNDRASKEAFGALVTRGLLSLFEITVGYGVTYIDNKSKDHAMTFTFDCDGARGQLITYNHARHRDEKSYVNTIVHEVAHIMQAWNKSALPFNLIIYACMGGVEGSIKSYRNNPLEIEANAVARAVVRKVFGNRSRHAK